MSDYCNRCGLPHEGQCLRDPDKREDLRSRLVLAVIDALEESDPLLVIGVGDNELKIGWDNE